MIASPESHPSKSLGNLGPGRFRAMIESGDFMWCQDGFCEQEIRALGASSLSRVDLLELRALALERTLAFAAVPGVGEEEARARPHLVRVFSRLSAQRDKGVLNCVRFAAAADSLAKTRSETAPLEESCLPPRARGA